MRNCPSWLIIFLVLPFNKTPLFSKRLITFIISFILLFVRVIPEPVIDEIFLKIFLLSKLSPAPFLAPVFFNSFTYEFVNEDYTLVGEINRSSRPINPVDCTI